MISFTFFEKLKQSVFRKIPQLYVVLHVKNYAFRRVS